MAAILGEVLGRIPIRHLQVGLLRQEGEVRQRIHFRSRVLVAIQQRLGKDVVNLQTAEIPPSRYSTARARSPSRASLDPRQHVEQRIEARTLAPAEKVVGMNAKIAAILAQLGNQAIQPAIQVFDQVQVLIEDCLSRSSIAAPEERVDVPVEKLVPLAVVDRMPASLHEISGQERERVTAAKHPIVVQPEPGRDHVEQRIDRPLGWVQAVLNFGGSTSAER